MGDKDSFDSSQKLSSSSVVHKPDVVGACAEPFEIDACDFGGWEYYLPQLLAQIDRDEYVWIKRKVKFDKSSTLDQQFPLLVAFNHVELIEADPRILVCVVVLEVGGFFVADCLVV